MWRKHMLALSSATLKKSASVTIQEIAVAAGLSNLTVGFVLGEMAHCSGRRHGSGSVIPPKCLGLPDDLVC